MILSEALEENERWIDSLTADELVDQLIKRAAQDGAKDTIVRYIRAKAIERMGIPLEEVDVNIHLFPSRRRT